MRETLPRLDPGLQARPVPQPGIEPGTPFGLQADTWPTDPHQPGLKGHFLTVANKSIYFFPSLLSLSPFLSFPSFFVFFFLSVVVVAKACVCFALTNS